jgi:hypothetical protein
MLLAVIHLLTCLLAVITQLSAGHFEEWVLVCSMQYSRSLITAVENSHCKEFNNNNNNILLTAIGLSPGGSGVTRWQWQFI